MPTKVGFDGCAAKVSSSHSNWAADWAPWFLPGTRVSSITRRTGIVLDRVLHEVRVCGDAREMRKAGPHGLALVMVAGYDVNWNREGAG